MFWRGQARPGEAADRRASLCEARLACKAPTGWLQVSTTTSCVCSWKIASSPSATVSIHSAVIKPCVRCCARCWGHRKAQSLSSRAQSGERGLRQTGGGQAADVWTSEALNLGGGHCAHPHTSRAFQFSVCQLLFRCP